MLLKSPFQGNLLQQDIYRLQRLQNRSARIITRCPSETIEQLHWPILSSRRSYHKGKLIFLCLHLFVPSYFLLHFNRTQLWITSNCIYEAIPTKRQTEIWRKSLSFYTRANIFNNLRLNIVKIEKLQTFCRRARHFFL